MSLAPTIGESCSRGKNPVGKIGNNDMGLWDTQPVQKRKSFIESGDMFQECSL